MKRINVYISGEIDMDKDLQYNLFNYATSELSQDAFLCWVLAHYNKQDKSEMCKLAEQFLIKILDLHGSKKEIPSKKIKIKQQEDKRDITIYFGEEKEKVSEKLVIFIEDKVDTDEHDNQIENYVESLNKKGFHLNNIIPVYFKTGYVSNKKKIFSKKVSIEKKTHNIDVVNFIDSHIDHVFKTSKNDIVKAWYRHITSLWPKSYYAIETFEKLKDIFDINTKFVVANYFANKINEDDNYICDGPDTFAGTTADVPFDTIYSKDKIFFYRIQIFNEKMKFDICFDSSQAIKVFPESEEKAIRSYENSYLSYSSFKKYIRDENKISELKKSERNGFFTEVNKKIERLKKESVKKNWKINVRKDVYTIAHKEMDINKGLEGIYKDIIDAIEEYEKID